MNRTRAGDIVGGDSLAQVGETAVPTGSTRLNWPALVAGLVLLVFLLVAPQVTSPYTLRLLTMIAVTTLPVIGLTLLVGFAGQVSLSQAGFLGAGAYGYAYCTMRLSWPWWIAMGITLVGAWLVSWAISWPILRLRGYYLAMATLGLGLIASSIFTTWTSVTGAFSGITGIPAPVFFGFELDTVPRFYYYSLFVAVVVIVLFRQLSSGDYGRRLRTMRESEMAARAFGINIGALKAEVFALCSTAATLGGILYAQLVSFISPESFALDSSINYLLATIVGGLASVWASVGGAAYVNLLPAFLSGNQRYATMMSGAVIVLLIAFLPGGLLELLGIANGGFRSLAEHVSPRRKV